MTKEKAIDLLDDLVGMVDDKDDSEYDTALKMGIQALSQESEIEENIIKYMKKYPNHVGNTDFWEGFYACRNVVLQLDDEECSPKEQEPCEDAISRQAVLDLLEDTNNGWVINEVLQLPSVNPQEPKTGHWIKDEFGNKCSCCGIHIDKYMKFNYCPNCGAKMIEPQESKDKE